ncbi:MAG TPA: DUF1028 domain-containing protein [Myxococcaceae bacterium]|nr:DUF1028 domain-containing protein [Myxococcaceae bacterium]
MNRAGESFLLPLFSGLAAFALPGLAQATYSIVAADQKTQQIGGAGTSCVGALPVRIIYGVAIGHGAVHAQAQLNTQGRDRAALRLSEDVDPVDIIAEITSDEFDPIAAYRQYGIVDLFGRSAGFTGDRDTPYAEDRQGTADPYVYSVQGNILTSVGVIDRAEAAFQNLGCDLADKLMLALEAGAEQGEGDSRCTPRGVPSDSAFIEVDPLDKPEGSFLRLEVTNTGSVNPLVLLREMFDEWRVDHPCP